MEKGEKTEAVQGNLRQGERAHFDTPGDLAVGMNKAAVEALAKKDGEKTVNYQGVVAAVVEKGTFEVARRFKILAVSGLVLKVKHVVGVGQRLGVVVDNVETVQGKLKNEGSNVLNVEVKTADIEALRLDGASRQIQVYYPAATTPWRAPSS